MGRWFVMVMGFLVLQGTCSAGNVLSAGLDADLDVGLHAGYRLDELDWNIAGNIGGSDPDILSELDWSDLEIHQVGISARIDAGRPDRHLFAHGRVLFDYGRIVDGENRDSDYTGDGRTLEWSRSTNDADDGEVYDASIGGGPGFGSASGRLVLIPLAGFSYHRQNLVLQNGFQVLSDPLAAPVGVAPAPVGPIPGLDSSYQAEWWGPWAGIDLHWSPCDGLNLSGGFAYHWAGYSAEGRWNLRSDLAQPVSFTHDADGSGTVLTFGAEYEFSAAWKVSLDASVRRWETGRGTDRIYFAGGSSTTTRLNEVNWESAALMIEVRRRLF